MCTNLQTLPMLAENRITSCAEDFGQRPLTNNIVTSYLPSHYFGRSMATHKNNDQFSPLGGKWTMANFRRTPDTAPASDRISGERSATAPDAEDLGQRPLTSSIVTLYLPGHYFGRSMATHKNNDQFSFLGGNFSSLGASFFGCFQPCWFFQMPLPSFVSWRALCCLGPFLRGFIFC